MKSELKEIAWEIVDSIPFSSRQGQVRCYS